MGKHLEDLWLQSADDGASAPIGIDLARPWAEVEDLLHAWSRERGRCIEMGMVLEQSRRLIGRLMAADGVTREELRRTKALLFIIESTLRAADAGGP